MTKIHVGELFKDKKQQKKFIAYAKVNNKWFTWTHEGVYYFDQESEAREHKTKLKNAGCVEVYVFHTKDVIG